MNDYSADVVVIGSGAGGLSAAVSAAEGGARVLLLEKRKILGGTTRLAWGMFSVESPVQKRLGITETVDDAYRAHMQVSNWMCDARMVRGWMVESQNVTQWLEDKGAIFDNVTAFVGDQRYYHQIGHHTGNIIVDRLSEAARRLGVQILTETRATELRLDETGGVGGLLAIQGERTIEVSARNVVIASGSISANKALIKRYFPFSNYDQTQIEGGLPFATGDGYYMAEKAGAAMARFLSILFMGPHNHPHNVHVGLLIRRPHVMMVNKFGMRYHDETLYSRSLWGWFSGQALEAQPDGVCYALIDSTTMTQMTRTHKENISGLEVACCRFTSGDITGDSDKPVGTALAYDDPCAWLDRMETSLAEEAKTGRVKIADSLGEIAAWMGADPDVLRASVAEYNQFCENGYDADFLKEKRYLLPISTPPFYALRGTQGIDTFIGGIRINHRMEVYDQQFKPIRGLYAAGVCTSGWLGHGYGISGTELGFSLFSGFSAGRNASTNIR